MSPVLTKLLARSARWADHPMARAALDEIRSLIGHYEARMHEPHRWALFHRRMAETLPSWRLLAQGHHRRMSRRYAAFAWATDEVAASQCLGAISDLKMPGS